MKPVSMCVEKLLTIPIPRITGNGGHRAAIDAAKDNRDVIVSENMCEIWNQNLSIV